MSESDSETPETTHDDPSSAPETPEESSGDAYLDKILEEGVLKGQARPELAQLLMAAFMVFALGWLAYTSSLTADFFIEDEQAIVANENLHRIPTISRGWGDGISPLAALTIAIDWTLGDGSPIPFRITQLMLHLLNAVLVFLLCRTIVRKGETEAPAMAGGLWFALIFTGTETVSALGERDVLLGVGLLLLSAVLMERAARGESLRLFDYVLALCAGGLSTVSGIGPALVALLLIGFIIAKHRLAMLPVMALYPLLAYLQGSLGEISFLDGDSTMPIYFGVGLIGAMLLTLSLSYAPGRTLRLAMGVGSAVVLFASAFVTNQQVAERQDEIFHWSRTNEACPDCFEPKLKLALLYMRDAEAMNQRAALDPIDAEENSRIDQSMRFASGFFSDARTIQSDLDGHLPEYASSLYKTDDIPGAIEVMRDAIALSPTDAELISTIAQWYAADSSESGDVQELRSALDYYDALDALDATTERDRLVRAECFLRLGLAREAVDQLRMIRDQEVLRDAQPLMKQIQSRMSRMQRFEQDFNQAAQSNRPYDELLRPRVSQLLAEGFVMRARYFAEELVRATGNANGEDWVQLGALYAGTGDLESLKEHWPPPFGLRDPWNSVADELVQQKNYNAAFAVLESEMERAVALETLAGIAREQDDLREAMGLYQQAANEFPERKSAWLALGELSIELEQTANLNAILERAAAAGATAEEIEALKSEAGLGDTPADQLQRTIIR